MTPDSPVEGRQLALIWAQASNGVIGRDGGIPWRLPEDLAHFKELTLGHPVVMGRRTWESLPPRFRPLEGRRNIVVTRSPEFEAEGAEVAHSLDAALALAAGAPLVWVIGGGELYRAALPLATRAEVTELRDAVEGDTHAPELDASWALAVADPADGWHESRDGIAYRFLRFERIAT